ncbi:hypothetical protein DL98DRAFT_557627 [Cadophora sp. DSE1049]|nr:hypothetical protein DL98DRAFT_557627 [Cadophora sp. DSE1049]
MIKNIKEVCTTPETTALLRKLAADSIVLLKNERRHLPLSASQKTVVIGPNAKTAVYCGGGSSSLAAYRAISPLEAIQSRCSSQNVQYAIGAYSHKELPILGPQVRTSTGVEGIHREISDEIILTNTDMLLLDYRCPRLHSELWYADIEGYLTAERDGVYEIGVCVYGTARLFASQVQGTAFFGAGTREERGTFPVKENTIYHIKVEFGSAPLSKLSDEGVVSFGGGGVRIGGCMKVNPEEQIRAAVALAKDADQVIICTGLNGDWEGEGCDRTSMDLPGHLTTLITSVASSNPNTTLILQTGSPITMPWLSQIPCLIQAWYGGNECGNAIADVLFGSVNPSGKLPLTFPKRVEDNPAFLNYRSEGGRTLYGEGVYVGYRYYEISAVEVLFPFGFGLSYTSFAFTDLKVEAGDEELRVSLGVQNIGDVAGAEVVQLYISPQSPSIMRPKKELHGFTKVFLEPGASKDVEILARKKDATSFWDESRSMWKSEQADDFRVESASAL